MSRLITNAIRSTSATADAITMDGSGNVTFPANATCSGTATGFGKILQYKVAKKTDTASTTSSSTTGVEISSDFRITLTPTNATSIIYCLLNVSVGIVTTYTSNYKIYKNTATDFTGTSTLIMPPDSGTGTYDGNMNIHSAGGGIMGGFTVTAFETASNTTERTYSPFWATGGSTTYLNRWSSGSFNMTSTFSVMEVAA